MRGQFIQRKAPVAHLVALTGQDDGREIYISPPINAYFLPFMVVFHLQTGTEAHIKHDWRSAPRVCRGWGEFAEVAVLSLYKKWRPVLSLWAPQLRAMVINPPVRELVSDRPRPLADKSTGPCPDWETHPCGLRCRWVIFPALSLVGWSRASGYEQAKWNTNAPRFPSEISIIHFHTFPWQHTVGFEGGAGNLNVPTVWKEVSDQQLSRCRLLALKASRLTLQVYFLFAQGVFILIKVQVELVESKCTFFFFFFYPSLSLFGFRVYTVGMAGGGIYYFMLRFSKKSPLSAISFSSINKPDSALSFSAWIYVEWFEGFKMASAVLFVFPVKCFPPVCFCGGCYSAY